MSESRGRFSLGVLPAMLVCAAAFLGIGAPAASAATTLDSYGYGGMQFGLNNGGLADPGKKVFNGVAVDPTTGNILISRNNEGDVRVYAPDPAAGGTDLTSIYTLGDPSFPAFAANLAVDPANGNVYLDDNIISPGAVYRYLTDGQPTPTYSSDSSFLPSAVSESVSGIAVDPTTHDVLVADSSGGRVVRVSADGTELGSFSGADAPGGPFQALRGVAVAPSGTIYVADASRRAVDRFDTTGAWQGSFDLVSGDVPQSISVNTVTGDVAVLVNRKGQTFVEGFTSTGEAKWETRVWFDTGGGAPIGLAWDGNLDRIYLGAESGRVSTLVPAVQPGVEAPVLVSNDQDSANVTAEVAAGAEPTTAWIEYCPAAAACGNYLVSNPGDSSNPWVRGPLHEGITGDFELNDDLPLPPVSKWKVRTVATNAKTENRSAEVTIETAPAAPIVTTGVAGSVTDTQARLYGTIDTLGSQTTYHFEYGTDTGYGSQAPISSEASAGNNRTPRAVAQSIDGLQPGTVYHYRLVAQNAGGETIGDDRTFETAAGPAPQRSYEQVTPVDKEGAQVGSEFHVQMDPAGNWIAVANVSGTPKDEGVRMRQNYLVRREADGWSDWFPIEAPQQAAGGIFESSTTGISPDGNHALVVSNRVLAPGGAYAGGGNLYAKDLRTGEYTFVGAAPGNDAYQALANGNANEAIFIASAPDLSWLLFWSPVPLTPEATGATLYRWTPSGGLEIESKIPDPLNPSAEVPGSGLQVPSAYRTVMPSTSTDGTVVAFAAGAVYRRENDVSTPVSVSHRTGDDETIPLPALFDAITPDGRYVFLHTSIPLTDDTPSLGSDWYGYRYDAETQDLIFIAPVDQSAEALYGIGADGRQAYFENSTGLVVWREGKTPAAEIITTGRPSAASARTYVTQNGRFIAWNDSDNQAWLYDAETNEKACVSCPPDGSTGKPARFLLNVRYMGNTLPRVITEDGTMFFDTASPLVNGDRNGKRDVYAFKDGRLTLISPGNGAFDAVWVGSANEGRDVYFQTDQSLVSQDVDGESDVYDARVGGGFASQNPPPPPPPCVRSDCGEAASGPVASAPFSSQKVPAGQSQQTKKCKKGYVKKTVKGKRRCVKKAKKKAPNKQAGKSRTRGN